MRCGITSKISSVRRRKVKDMEFLNRKNEVMELDVFGSNVGLFNKPILTQSGAGMSYVNQSNANLSDKANNHKLTIMADSIRQQNK